MKIVVVLGVSGVGKSTLIEEYLKIDPEFVHLQAGNLIKSNLKHIPQDKLRLGTKEDILKNQYLMIDAFWKEVNRQKCSKVIFDGHSVIDTGKELLSIPTEIIKALKPSEVIFMKVDECTLIERRALDTSRHRPILDEKTIKFHQDQALEQARVYSKCLNVPFTLLLNPSKLSV